MFSRSGYRNLGIIIKAIHLFGSLLFVYIGLLKVSKYASNVKF